MLRMERGQTLISNKLKKLIKKKRNADVKTIIGEATPSDLTDSRGSTLLHLAVACDNEELAEYCIDVGCNVNAQDVFKNTPLTLALSATLLWNVNLIKRLLEADADILLTNQANKCPLFMLLHDPARMTRELARDVWECMVAAMNRNNRVDAIADVIVQTYPQCKLEDVLYMRNAEWTKAVLQRLETIDSEDSAESIIEAMKLIDLPNTQALVYYGPNADDRMRYFFRLLLTFAVDADSRNLKIVRAFVKDIPEWAIWDMYAIEIMARLFETADEEALNIFLQHNIHLRVQRSWDIDLMAHCGGNSNPGIVELMRQNLIKTNKFPSAGLNKKSVLHFAVQNGVYETVKTLFEFGIDPNIADAHGRTPLFSAFSLPHSVEEEKRKKCVLTLLMSEANPQIFDEHGESILNFTSSEGDWCVAQVVLQHLAWCKLRGKIDKRFDEVSNIVINNDTKLKSYYNHCLEQLQEMKKFKYCGNVTIYKLIIQETLVTARSVRYNSAIKISDMHPERWDYYYGKLLKQIICTLKSINNCKSEIRCIILDCLEVLRPYEPIVDHILDSFTLNDFLHFRDVFDLS